jgi:hypothetical protein
MSARVAKKPAAKAPAKRAAPAKVAKKSAAPGGRTKAQKAAALAARRAKAAAAVGPFGSASQRALRDIAIVTGIAAGASVQEIAAEFALSERAVREVCARREARPSLLDARPIQVLEGFVRDTQDTLDRLKAAATAAAASNNLPVLVGAAKAEVIARRELIDLMVTVGAMPADLRTFRAESVLRQAAERLAMAMMELKRGEIDVDGAWAIFDEIVTGRDERPQLHAV